MRLTIAVQRMLAGLERVQALKDQIGSRLPEAVRRKIHKLGIPEGMAERMFAVPLGSLPGGKRVLRMDVPRGIVRKMETGNAELRYGPLDGVRDLIADIPYPQVAKALESVTAIPFMRDVPLRGGVPAKYVKKSPHYRGVTRDEVVRHLRSLRTEPREVGKDVLRSLTGVSHRPSTTLKMQPPAPPKVATKKIPRT